MNFQMFNLDTENEEEPEIKLPTSVGSSKKQENSRKTSTSPLLTMLKLLTVWISQTLLRNLYAGQKATVRTAHGKADWLQIGKGVCESCILSPCLCEMLGWKKHKMKSRFLGEISITSGMQMTPPLWPKVKRN